MTVPLIQNPDVLESRLKEIPTEPGVYLMRDATDQILYVGKSKKLRSRVRSYFRFTGDLPPRIQRMVVQVCEIEFIVTDNESEALALEDNLIKTYQPPYNVLLKEEKNTPTCALRGQSLTLRFTLPATAVSTKIKISTTGPIPMWACCATPSAW